MPLLSTLIHLNCKQGDKKTKPILKKQKAF